MDTSREDVSIAIRSALIDKGTKQKFSLFVLIILSITFIFIETIETKPLNYFRAFIKDVIYRGALVVSSPSKSINNENFCFDPLAKKADRIAMPTSSRLVSIILYLQISSTY